jgi:hypothetical protein
VRSDPQMQPDHAPAQLHSSYPRIDRGRGVVLLCFLYRSLSDCGARGEGRFFDADRDCLRLLPGSQSSWTGSPLPVSRAGGPITGNPQTAQIRVVIGMAGSSIV